MCQQLALLILNNLIVLPKTILGDKSCFSGCEILKKIKIKYKNLVTESPLYKFTDSKLYITQQEQSWTTVEKVCLIIRLI